MTQMIDVRETLHGVEIADPYRWLEETDDPDVRRWTAEQNAATRQALDALPFRDRVRGRLDELLQVGLLEVPVVAAGAAFFLRREAHQDQSVLYAREPGSGDRALVDPNELAGDHLVTIDWFFPSADGRLVAYGLSRGGDELSTLHVVEVASGRVLDDRIPDTRFSSVAWLPDASGFYYTRYPAKGSVPEGEERYNTRVRFHGLGDDPAQDSVVFGEGREPTDRFDLAISRDGRFLLIHVQQGWAKTTLFVLDHARDGELRSTGEEHEAIFAGHFADGSLYALTNWGAPNWRVLELDPETLDLGAARTVLAEREGTIVAEIALVGGRLVAHELEDASSRIRVYALPEGALARELELPDLGSVQGTPSLRTPGIAGEWDGEELLLGFTSFLHPPAVLRSDLATGAVTRFAQLEAPPGFDPLSYETRQVHCRSADGTSIPIFLIHRRGLRLDGSAPVFLTGYGGFNIGMTPYWINALPLWVDSGGVFAVAVLRGGNEFGERWHRGGMLDRKQNVFDDFVAAADWLVDEAYTSRERLAIAGGSNGGLLVGAALTQRPDLCRAVVCEVPLLDMLRYHRFQVAKLWISEYGSPDDPEQFRWLQAYSPYHHVVDGERYPAVLLTTALGDTRVDPMHARKMAARLQAATASELPVLVRVDEDAGHGVGKPRSKQLDSATDLWTFVFWQLDVEPAA
jgi:prolyl oligopeptidase